MLVSIPQILQNSWLFDFKFGFWINFYEVVIHIKIQPKLGPAKNHYKFAKYVYWKISFCPLKTILRVFKFEKHQQQKEKIETEIKNCQRDLAILDARLNQFGNWGERNFNDFQIFQDLQNEKREMERNFSKL